MRSQIIFRVFPVSLSVEASLLSPYNSFKAFLYPFPCTLTEKDWKGREHTHNDVFS